MAAPAGVTASPVTGPTNPVIVRLRREAGTSPGRMRLFSLVLLALLAVTGVASFAAVARRNSGVNTVARSEPLVVDAQALDTALSEADATAANAFLGGGIEPTDLSVRYQQDISTAARLLADAAERSGPAGDVQGPLETLSAQLPVYTGLVDTARADNRQGFPVGAAYLRQASRLMSGTILPAAQSLLSVHNNRVLGGNSRARSVHDTALVGFLLLVVLVGMIGVQVWLYRQTNRLFNLPLVAATALAVIMLAVVLGQLRSEAADTAQARDHAYATISLLAEVRTVAFKASGDESLTLIGRGNGGAFEDDFKAQVAKLGSLLASASAVVIPTEATTLEQAGPAFQQYLAVHQNIRKLDDGGQFDQAVKLAVGGGTASASNQAFAGFDAPVNGALTASEPEFAHHLTNARRHLRGLLAAIVVVIVATAALALWGFQQRINEYR